MYFSNSFYSLSILIAGIPYILEQEASDSGSDESSSPYFSFFGF